MNRKSQPGTALATYVGGSIELEVEHRLLIEVQHVRDAIALRCGLPGRPKLLITPIFHDFFRIFPVFPGASGRALWIPGVQTLKMGERWGKMGKKWVKNGITGLQKTALMHASAHLGRHLDELRKLPATLLSVLQDSKTHKPSTK